MTIQTQIENEIARAEYEAQLSDDSEDGHMSAYLDGYREALCWCQKMINGESNEA